MNDDQEKTARDNGYCASDSHDFVCISEENGNTHYKCAKCGLEFTSNFLSRYDFYKTFFGSYFDNTSYVWHPEDMQPAQIRKFGVSFGNLPVKNISYEDGFVTNQNSINFSRDGGLDYPDRYFDPNKSRLDEQQIAALYQCLDGIQLETWKSDPGQFEMYSYCGYFHAESFVCTFDNGRKFICNAPEDSDGFHKLTVFLSKLCRSQGMDIYSYDPVPMKPIQNQKNGLPLSERIKLAVSGGIASLQERRRMKRLRKTADVNDHSEPSQQPAQAVVTACCGVTVRENSSYCPECGKRIEDKENLPHMEIADEFDDTLWLCSCGTGNDFQYSYCVNCGKKRS